MKHNPWRTLSTTSCVPRQTAAPFSWQKRFIARRVSDASHFETDTLEPRTHSIKGHAAKPTTEPKMPLNLHNPRPSSGSQINKCLASRVVGPSASRHCQITDALAERFILRFGCRDEVCIVADVASFVAKPIHYRDRKFRRLNAGLFFMRPVFTPNWLHRLGVPE